MSKIIFVLLAIGAIIFLSSGGLQKAKGFSESLGLGNFSESFDDLLGGNDLESSNSQTTDSIKNLSDEQKARLESNQTSLNSSLLSIQNQINTVNDTQSRTVAKTLALGDIIKSSSSLDEVISIQNKIISKQFGDGAKFTINEKRRQDRSIRELKAKNFGTAIASSGLTGLELADIASLDKRRAKSQGRKFKSKRNGLDTVTLKRIEEARAAKTLGLNNFSSRIRGKQGRRKLFANDNFDLGLPSTATQKDRDFMIKQRNAHRGQQAKSRQNKINARKQQELGLELQKTFGSTAAQQRKSLAAKGIKLNGKLNARALAKLRERGLI